MSIYSSSRRRDFVERLIYWRAIDSASGWVEQITRAFRSSSDRFPALPSSAAIWGAE
nr:MAG TPA: hypothetical protein [Caudoviricetes sp.]